MSIIGVSIIIGCLILASSIVFASKNFSKSNSPNKYEMISNDSNLIILDTETGIYWRKYINPTEGPTEWTEERINSLSE